MFTGGAFFLSFAAITSGSTSPIVMLTFYAAVAWIWVWHTALYAALRRVDDNLKREIAHA